MIYVWVSLLWLRSEESITLDVPYRRLLPSPPLLFYSSALPEVAVCSHASGILHDGAVRGANVPPCGFPFSLFVCVVVAKYLQRGRLWK